MPTQKNAAARNRKATSAKARTKPVATPKQARGQKRSVTNPTDGRMSRLAQIELSLRRVAARIEIEVQSPRWTWPRQTVIAVGQHLQEAFKLDALLTVSNTPAMQTALQTPDTKGVNGRGGLPLPTDARDLAVVTSFQELLPSLGFHTVPAERRDRFKLVDDLRRFAELLRREIPPAYVLTEEQPHNGKRSAANDWKLDVWQPSTPMAGAIELARLMRKPYYQQRRKLVLAGGNQPPATAPKRILVTRNDVAPVVGNANTKSMRSWAEEWGQPVFEHRGSRPNEYDLLVILPKLKEQFPLVTDEDWSHLKSKASQRVATAASLPRRKPKPAR